LSPIETAIDTLTVKNKEILTNCNRYADNPSIDLNPFTMLLNGVIDAAVMGGISNYEKVSEHILWACHYQQINMRENMR